jgi:tetratricopeptide (TPR) repeat protein
VGLLLGFAASCGHDSDYYLTKADGLAKRGECAEAVLNYRNAIQRDPALGAAYYGLGVCQFKLGSIEESAQTLFHAVELMPSNDEAAIESANVTLSLYIGTGRPQGLYDRLTKLVGDILKRNPKSPDGLSLQGSILLDDHKVLDAIAVLEQAYSLRPSDPDISLLLAEALKREGKGSEAEQMVAGILDQHPQYSAGYDWLAEQYASSNRRAEAEIVLKSKVRNLPDESGGIIQLASFYQQQQNPAEVKKALSLILDRPKMFRYGLLQVGDFYRAAGRPAEAAAYYAQGAASDKNSKAIYEGRLAGVYMAQKKRSDALQAINEAIRETPNDPEFLNLRALILLEGGDEKDAAQAIADWKAAIKLRPRDASLYFQLGRAYLARRDRDSARSNFINAVNRNPRYVEPRIGLAQISRERSDFKSALRYSEEALQLDPRNSRARLLHAAGLAGSGNLRAGRSELDALVQEYPGSEDVQLESGLLFLAENQPQAAEKIFAKALQSTPRDSRALAGLARVYLAQKNYDGAIKLLAGEVAKAPDWWDAREYLAASAAALNRLDIALQQYKVLADKYPDSADYKIGLAAVYQAQGDKASAIQTYEAARVLSPDDPVIIGWLALLRDSTGQKREADADYQRSLALNPSDPALLNNRAYFIAESGGDLDEGLRLIKAALQNRPTEPGILDTLGWLYTKKGMNDSAVEVLSNLVKAHPDEPAFRYHLGVALFQKGDRAGAKRELGTGLSKHPSKEDEEKIRSFLTRIG